MPSSARAPAEVAPSATVVGFGRFVLDFFGASEGFVCDVLVVGFEVTFDVSCAPDVAAAESREMSSAKVRREYVRVVNTNTGLGMDFVGGCCVLSKSSVNDSADWARLYRSGAWVQHFANDWARLYRSAAWVQHFAHDNCNCNCNGN